MAGSVCVVYFAIEINMATFANGFRSSYSSWLLKWAFRRKWTDSFSPRKILILEKTTRLEFEHAVSSARASREVTQEELKDEVRRNAAC